MVCTPHGQLILNAVNRVMQEGKKEQGLVPTLLLLMVDYHVLDLQKMLEHAISKSVQ